MEIENIKEMTIEEIILEMKDQLLKNDIFKLNEDKLMSKLDKIKTYYNANYDIIKNAKSIIFNIYRDYSNGTDKITILVRIRKEYATIAQFKIYYNISYKLPIKYLKALIQNVVNDDNIPCHPYLTDTDFIESLSKKQVDKINRVRKLAEELIYTEQCPDSNNYHQLLKAGINIKAGEKDSFGWITAVLLTEKGSILLG